MLLDEIVNLLSDNGSIESALIKTQRLLHQIGHKELVPWVTDELRSYPDDAELPTYRIVQSQPHAHIQWGLREDPDYFLPLHQLNPEQLENITKTGITTSVGVLEQQVKTYHETHEQLVRRLPPEYAAAFQKELTPGTHILRLWCVLNMAQLEAIVVQVRSRLLEFCLQLQGVVGIAAPAEQLVEKAATVDAGSMFRTAIFHINTGGGTAVVGSTHVQVNNQLGNIDALLREVAKLGYDEAELEELRQAVLEDKSKGEKPTITEGKTSQWFLNALKKVGKGAVKVGVDIVSKVISDSLKNYGG